MAKPARPRFPLQIVASKLNGEVMLYALCDDGSMWWTFETGPAMSDGWQRIADIPQDDDDAE